VRVIVSVAAEHNTTRALSRQSIQCLCAQNMHARARTHTHTHTHSIRQTHILSIISRSLSGCWCTHILRHAAPVHVSRLTKWLCIQHRTHLSTLTRTRRCNQITTGHAMSSFTVWTPMAVRVISIRAAQTVAMTQTARCASTTHRVSGNAHWHAGTGEVVKQFDIKSAHCSRYHSHPSLAYPME
jgi:hypothetical protein